MKLSIASFISRLPSNRARIALYRKLLGYRIENSHIGYGTIIRVKRFSITRARIGNNCRFVGPMEVVICDGAKIGAKNRFVCGDWTTRYDSKPVKFSRFLKIGCNAMITAEHHFDVAGAFILGDSSWIAGHGSQFWTHGAGVVERDIRIGSNCYIGSAVKFCPGTSIGNNVLVGIGSVVSRKIEEDDLMIAGVPAKIVKCEYDWKSNKYKCK